MKSVLFVAVMAFAVASVMSADAEGPLETDLNVLSKEELIAKVNADRREHADTKAELDAAHEKISSLQVPAYPRYMHAHCLAKWSDRFQHRPLWTGKA